VTSLLARTAAVLTAALVWLVPGPALADGPLRLDSQLTDRADVLGARRPQAQAALDDLRRDTGLQLFVVFVHSFDGRPAQDWADQTARRSDLGDRDALLAVATRDRSYAYSFDQAYPLTDAQLASVAATAIEPALAQNDWAGAVVGAANGYRAALAGQPVPVPSIVPGTPDAGGGSGAAFGRAALVAGLVVAALAVLAAAGGWAWWRRSRRRAAVGARRAGEPTLEELSSRANTLLIELDNELRSSEQELDVARGQYGEEATAAFTAALEAARQDVAEAFRLRMALDEPESAAAREPAGPELPAAAPAGAPRDEPARRAALTEIIRRCEAADQRLDAEAEAFDRLRELEPRVEQAIAALQARRSALTDRLSTSSSTLEDLRGRYADQALAAVATNPRHAAERLDFAAAALTRAEQAVARQDRSQAALAVRAAEEALGQADTLLAAIGRVADDLEAARVAVDALLVEVEGEVAAGKAAGAGDGKGALAAAVAAGEEALTAVRSGLGAPTTDPRAAVRRLQEVDAALDRALAESREAAERVARARGLLDHALSVARAEVAAAGDFITTRRGGVGGQARTWLAEAQRQLSRAEAMAGTDPVAALSAAQEAHRLATMAGNAARSDVEGWEPAGVWGGGYGRGRGDFGDAFLGAVLGGILAGGGRHPSRGGWGGGFGGGWGGGFGGSISRARRGGGGRF
jgi:uncharacterized membrane protein YgcG